MRSESPGEVIASAKSYVSRHPFANPQAQYKIKKIKIPGESFRIT